MGAELHGYPLLLPIGITDSDGDTCLRSFTLRKSGGVTETILANEAYRRNHPQKWTTRVVASVLEEIEGVPIFAPFKASRFKRVPELVKDIPISDMAYVIMMGHMFTHGFELDAGKNECPECSKKDHHKLDLRNIKWRENPFSSFKRFYVDLPTGFLREPGKTPLPHHGVRWNRFYFRPTTMRDAIRHEKHWTRTNMVNFNMRVAADAIVGVEAWDREGETQAKVNEMDEKPMKMEGLDLVDDLDSADRRAVRAIFQRLPGITLAIEHECASCGEDVDLSVDLSNFFPLA